MGSNGGSGIEENREVQNAQSALQQQQLELQNLAAMSMLEELELLQSQLTQQSQLFDAQTSALDILTSAVESSELEFSNLLEAASAEQRIQSEQVAQEAERARSAEDEQAEFLLDFLGQQNAITMNNRRM